MQLSWKEINLGRHLQTQVYWARAHCWPAGRLWDRVSMPAYLLYLVSEGELEVQTDGCQHHLKAGDAWLYPYSRYRTVRIIEDAKWLSLGLEATLYEKYDALAPLAPAHWQPNDMSHAIGWLDRIAVNDENRNLVNSLMNDGLTKAIVGWLWDSLDGDLSRLAVDEAPGWLNRALTLIHEDPCVSVAELVKQSGYSAAQFRRAFHQTMNTSPREYLIQRRLNMACRLLASADIPVSEVATRCGFNDPAQFSRHFKQAYRVAPLSFRRTFRQY